MMIEYPKALYRAAGTHEFTTMDVTLDPMLVSSSAEEKVALRSGWSDWHIALKRAEALCRRNRRIATMRRFFQEWKWALEGFIVVAGSISLVFACIPQK